MLVNWGVTEIVTGHYLSCSVVRNLWTSECSSIIGTIFMGLVENTTFSLKCS